MKPKHHKAVFFDRDGVLNVDTGYPHKTNDCILIPDAPLALKLVNDRGYHAYIVTNQGGIALGLYNENDMHEFNATLIQKLAEKGGEISDVAFCPHHPDAQNPELRDCQCRKPKPAMLLDLATRHNIDLAQSIMVGDRTTDIDAANAAGCKGFLFNQNNLYDFIKPIMENLDNE